MKTPLYRCLTLVKVKGGKRSLWEATHRDFTLIGKAPTADGAIRAWLKQYRTNGEQRLQCELKCIDRMQEQGTISPALAKMFRETEIALAVTG